MTPFDAKPMMSRSLPALLDTSCRASISLSREIWSRNAPHAHNPAPRPRRPCAPQTYRQHPGSCLRETESRHQCPSRSHLRNQPHTRGRTSPDLVLQTRARAISEERIATVANQEQLLQVVQSLPHGTCARVGPEVTTLTFACTAMNRNRGMHGRSTHECRDNSCRLGG